MKRGKHEIEKVKVIDRYLVLVLIAVLALGIAYAQIVDEELTVAGNVESEVQEGVFITQVVYKSNEGADTANSVINYYLGTMMDSKIVLGSASSSTITYEVTVYNNTDKEQVFIKTLTDDTDEILYSNTNIGYSVSIEDYVTTIAPKQRLTFTITYAYKGTDTSNTVLENKLNFRFREKPVISLSNVGATYTLNNIYVGHTEEYEFTVKNNNTTYTNGVPMTYAFEVSQTAGSPLTAEIYDANGNKVTGDVTLTSDGSKVENSYKLKLIWDSSKTDEEYEGKEYSCNVKLVATPTEAKYLDYTIEKEFNIEITTCSHEYENGICTICGDKKLMGSGTEEDPYTIGSIEELVLFADSVTNGKTYEGEYVKLTRDLDFKSAESYVDSTRTDFEEYGYTGSLMTAITTGEGFKPIGSTEIWSEIGFFGTFDGNGKIISNLRIYLTDFSNECVALFATNFGTIKNMGLKDCDINIDVDQKTDAYEIIYASLCGYNYGTVEGCFSSGNILVNADEISAPLRVGGVVGSSASSNGTIEIKNCYNKVNIEVIRNETTIKNTAVGGVVCNSSNTIITNCYNIGKVSGTYSNGGLNVGGVVGYGCTQGTNLYNLGEVYSSASGTPVLGGVVGQGKNIENCYNTGSVLYEASSTKYIGAVIGSITGTQTNSYYLNNTELNGIGRNYSGTSQPTKVEKIEDMPTVLSVVGDEFKADTNNINGGYPLLEWQSSTAN